VGILHCCDWELYTDSQHQHAEQFVRKRRHYFSAEGAVCHFGNDNVLFYIRAHTHTHTQTQILSNMNRNVRKFDVDKIADKHFPRYDAVYSDKYVPWVDKSIYHEDGCWSLF